MSEPPPPHWIFGGRPIQPIQHETILDRLCYALSYDLMGRSILGRRDLRYLGVIPYGQPPPVTVRPGQKVKVRWAAPTTTTRRQAKKSR